MVDRFVNRARTASLVSLASLLLAILPGTGIFAMDIQITVGSADVASKAVQRVTIHVDQVPLAVVVQAIARQAGLNPAYNERLIPSRIRVTLHVEHALASDAFQEALRGTGLVAHVEPTGFVAIIRADAQATGEIRGRVVDAATKQPIRGAMIGLDENDRIAETGADGSYRLADVVPGHHTISVRRLGYARVKQSVTVTDGMTASLDVMLTPASTALDEVVVTGTIIPTELRAVPNAMTVITAKDIEQRGITRIDQLFRGAVPGVFASEQGSSTDAFGKVQMFSRGATTLSTDGNAAISPGTADGTNPIKTYVDGVELADPFYLSQIDPKSIERIEILTGPQASTIYGSNAINGVMQIFTKRGTTARPQVMVTLLSGFIQNNFSGVLTPQHDHAIQASGMSGALSFSGGGSWNFTGAWTPAQRVSVVNGFGGLRGQYSHLTGDASIRMTNTVNKQNGGSYGQAYTALAAQGITRSNFGGRDVTARNTIASQTLGLNLNLTPTSWWTHEMGAGKDIASPEDAIYTPSLWFASDTALGFLMSRTERSSLRYVTTVHGSMISRTDLLLSVGIDGWHSLSTSLAGSPVAMTGTLTGIYPGFPTRQTGHDTGVFVQGRIGIQDILFLTYGLRAEWNPNYGSAQEPNMAPRYGVSLTHDIGSVTAKVRASYGRSTRPPGVGQSAAGDPVGPKSPVRTLWGPINTRVANPELGPEYQQGGEGGLELYWGNRGSLIVTRYNQTVDALLASVAGADSTRSLIPYAQKDCTLGFRPVGSDGYCYWLQSQILNVGSIRNQGWESQGSVTLGPLTTRGTYSWTKSRVIGITPKYRMLLTGSQYEVGQPFDYLPEHTWAIDVTYAYAATTLALNINGIGLKYRSSDDLSAGVSNYRLDVQRPRMNLPSNYRAMSQSYAVTDLNVTHRLWSSVEGIAQIHNVTNVYQNDFARFGTASLGRQSKFGARLRF